MGGSGRSDLRYLRRFASHELPTSCHDFWFQLEIGMVQKFLHIINLRLMHDSVEQRLDTFFSFDDPGFAHCRFRLRILQIPGCPCHEAMGQNTATVARRKL